MLLDIFYMPGTKSKVLNMHYLIRPHHDPRKTLLLSQFLHKHIIPKIKVIRENLYTKVLPNYLI